MSFSKEEVLFLMNTGFKLSDIMNMELKADTTQPDTVSGTAYTSVSSVAPAEPAESVLIPPSADPPADPPEKKEDPQAGFENTFNKMMDDMKAMFTQQMGLLQAANIRQAVQTEEQQVTPEDLIANIIHPPVKARKEN